MATMYLIILLTFIGGVILIDLGIFTKTQTNHLFKWGVPADGEIVKVEDETLPGGQHRLHPIIRFMTSENKEITEELSVKPNDMRHYTTGEHLNIVYNPQDLTDVKIDNMHGRKWLPNVFLVTGALMMLAAAHQLIMLTVR
jgi:hypothetical protein